MSKIHRAEQTAKADKADGTAEAQEAKALQKVGNDAVAKSSADDVAPKKLANQGIRGPNYQPIGMDPRQAKALGILVLGEEEGIEKAEAEQQLDEIWYSLSDKERLAAGRTERFRVDMDSRLVRMQKRSDQGLVVKGQLSARTIERGRRNAILEMTRYQHLLAEDARMLLDRFIVETAGLIDSAYRGEQIRGAPSDDLAELQVDLVRKIIYQEVQSRLRRMGDRGIRHIMGNIDLTEQMFATLSAHVDISPKERFIARIVHVHHDLGYTCHAAQVSYQAGRMHRHYSARIFNDEWNRYRKVIAPRDLLRARDAVSLHAHLDYDWLGDPLGSCVRIADHLMPFQQHWTYPSLADIKDGPKLADDLYTALKHNERAAAGDIRQKLWDAVMKDGKFSALYKEDLLSGLRPFDKGSFTVELGQWAGVISGFRYSKELNQMDVAVTPDDTRRALQVVFDVGQDQLFFFARKRGATEEDIRSGQPLRLRCREAGPVAMNIFVGSLPERKLQFKVKRREAK